MKEWCEAQQNKPATVAEKRSIFEHHLRGFLGARRLDEIDVGLVQGLKAAMNAGGNRHGRPLALKTRNNVLGILSNATSWPSVNWSWGVGRPRTASTSFASSRAPTCGYSERYLRASSATRLRARLRQRRVHTSDVSSGRETLTEPRWPSAPPLASRTRPRSRARARPSRTSCSPRGSRRSQGIHRPRQRSPVPRRPWCFLRHPPRNRQQLLRHRSLRVVPRLARAAPVSA